MNVYLLTYKAYGNRSILIEWPPEIDKNILSDLLNFKKLLLQNYVKVNVEIINAYNSLTILYDDTIENVYDEILVLKSLHQGDKTNFIAKKRRWEIPVCYDTKFGLDLEKISQSKKRPVEQIIEVHSAPIYTNYFIGFLPGFLYLGGLPESLHMERKSSPRPSIPKGAVGIGGQQTGIYPSKSPGGWQIIGNSPLEFFDINEKAPCFVNSGDEVVFKSITLEEYCSIKEDVEKGVYKPKSIQV